jgi:hypothetical protein
MKKRESALAYTTLGWQVFPLHTVIGTGCSCGNLECESRGKHPRIKHGLLNASDDPAQIAEWWGRWPDANIGVRTGEESGIVVIDIDDMGKRGLYDIPKTVWQRTGGGGEHHIFLHPKRHIKTTVGVVPGIDSRGDGGYIVAPPSNHVNGFYEWIESPFDGCDIADVPDWWVHALDNPVKKTRDPSLGGEKIPNGFRHNEVFNFGVRSWKSTQLSETVLGAMLHAYNKEMCLQPLPEAEIEAMVVSISQYDGKTEAEWLEEQEYLKTAKAYTAEMRESRQKRITDSLVNNVTRKAGPPPEFMPPEGLIRDVAEFIMAQAERPLPLLSVSAAVALVAVLAGGKYETYTGLGPNLMLVALAESGSGKQKPKNVINNILLELDLYRFLGADDIASAPGLIAELADNASKLFFLDEFGYALQSITNKNSSSTKREIMSTMMKLYSSYGTTYNGTAYADKKARPKTIIQSPCFVLQATSTHQTFYDALSSEHGSDGFIARMLVIPCGEEREDRVNKRYDRTIPTGIKARLIELSGIQFVGKKIVWIPDEVDDALINLDNSMTKLMAQNRELKEQARAIYSRVAENATKLAMVYAISMSLTDPIIDHSAFVWGREIALWCANNIMERISENVADNETERLNKKMVLRVQESGREGITRRDLQRRFLNMKAWERDDMLKSTIEMGLLFEHGSRLYHPEFKDILESDDA